MTIKSLRKQIEKEFDVIDPVGASIRTKQRRIATLQRKGAITAAEYKELSGSALALHDLERQHKELIQFSNALDPDTAKLMKLNTLYEKLNTQYEAGKLDKEVYLQSLQKLVSRLTPVREEAISGMTVTLDDLKAAQYHMNRHLGSLFTNAFFGFLICMILIPILFSCSFQ